MKLILKNQEISKKKKKKNYKLWLNYDKDESKWKIGLGKESDIKKWKHCNHVCEYIKYINSCWND